MAARVYRPLKVIAFNENSIWRQRYELSKQLQDLHIDVALLSETHLNPMRGSIFLIITFIVQTASRKEKAELPLQLEKAFPTTIETRFRLLQ
jgi:hypothetical protein